MLGIFALHSDEASSHDLRDLTDLLDHRGEGFGLERLFAIRNRFRRVGVDFDDESIRTGSDGGTGDRGDVIRKTSGMTGVEDDG